jgi:hypothetical protein
MRSIYLIAIGTLLFAFPSVLSAQSSESRYNKEFVFVHRMRNLSFGVSPTIMSEFMPHERTSAQTSVIMPSVHLMAESCIWDLGNGGSFGTGAFISYGKYTYFYEGENGYGGNQVNVKTGMTQVLAGLSYHYTIRTRMEAYTRLMLGVVIGSYNSDRAGATHDMNAKIIWNGVVGLRWYFSNSFGVYTEGGYTSGCVNAGITYRW